MTRPMTLHKGFFIPNGNVVASPVMCEPDQIDYNIPGNAQWGVVTGCEVTISAGTTASATAGIAVVNSVPVIVAAGQTVVLGSGSSQGRWDLVGCDGAGTLTVVVGTPAANPVFPDPPTTFTVFAAVFAAAGNASFSDYVLDKRLMLPTVLISNASGGTTVILNRLSGVDTFKVTADGTIQWNNNDTSIQRISAGALQVNNQLVVNGPLTSNGDMTAIGGIAATGVVTGANLMRSSSFPTSAPDGTLLVNGGLPYFRRSGVWEQVVTSGTGSDQVGDIKFSMRSAAQMPGWLQMNGQVVHEADQPNLFGIDGLQSFITGTSPNRVMQLPDATDRVLLPSNSPGQTGGSDTINVYETNMPQHDHDVSIDNAGLHDHAVSMQTAGSHHHFTVMPDRILRTQGLNTYVGLAGTHDHPVLDQGHQHNGASGWAGVDNWPFVALAWGGRNKLDGPINDSSHTYSVEPMDFTSPAQSNIKISSAGSEHQHLTEDGGDHVHVTSISVDGLHGHVVHETPKGGGAPINVKPKYLTVYCYIKV